MRLEREPPLFWSNSDIRPILARSRSGRIFEHVLRQANGPGIGAQGELGRNREPHPGCSNTSLKSTDNHRPE
jgi:hypothetical protein